ncbi:hypothetical protein I7I51_05577 [Histoplasma capsulatum]|uniref:Uncharacterized protein n=1 Tax=Ajellomyces capsulatus TaxID=5037 RepID=A0A8A1M836_AJECA|nr:conserved hypothetical protein [Histoplasma mississippiense (nom. inval.)]EDN06837.1 conserved hypothetical protein [Histoplasma mississippiense (nom. inval.)]QSS60774.1 hypothetical protein I7I51_05577 [Histoplasma capsulatum]
MGSTHNGPKPTYPVKVPVLHHSLVTDDFNALAFQGASSLQLQQGLKYQEAAPSSSHLISSPYNRDGHHLDLHTLDPSSQLLAKALTVLKPIRSDYAVAEYIESFNWKLVMDVLRDLAIAEGHEWKDLSFHVVTFRSVLLPTADSDRLMELDLYSHWGATVSGGLLKYWFGIKDEKFRNLATCIWRSKEDARRGGLGPWHRQAIATANELYESVEFKTWKLTIADGIEVWEIADEKNEI